MGGDWALSRPRHSEDHQWPRPKPKGKGISYHTGSSGTLAKGRLEEENITTGALQKGRGRLTLS